MRALSICLRAVSICFKRHKFDEHSDGTYAASAVPVENRQGYRTITVEDATKSWHIIMVVAVAHARHVPFVATVASQRQYHTSAVMDATKAHHIIITDVAVASYRMITTTKMKM